MIEKKRTAAVGMNLFVGIMSWVAWLCMVFGGFDGSILSNRGWESLKYFTVLSNLLNGSVSLVYGYRISMKKSVGPALKKWKLIVTTAVSLTFFTVILFLGPLYGYRSMFQGANFWLHLVLPVLSILGFLFLEENCRVSANETWVVMIAPFLYEIGYVANIVLNGIGEWPNRNDFYGFLSWGYGIGALIAAGILLISWGIGSLWNAIGKRTSGNI